MSCEAWDDYCDRINDTNEELKQRIEYHTQYLAKAEKLMEEFHSMDPEEEFDRFMKFYHEHIFCKRGTE